MIDEFPVLGNMKFLATSLGILAGYGLRFYLVVQAYQQLVKIYGQENTFIDNCRYILIYAPNNPQDAEKFSKMIGKKSVAKENLSVSGSRYAVALNNLNTSSQEIAVDLINPDELMKMPYEDCIILGHNMPPYMGKKNIFYADKRFSWKVFNENVDTGKVETGFAAPYKQKDIDDEVYMLPSQVKKRESAGEEEKKEAVIVENEKIQSENEGFNPIDFLENYHADENGEVEEWDAPFNIELDDGEPPPKAAEYNLDDFDNEGDVVYS